MLNPIAMTGLMVNARRAPLDRTPDVPYEDVAFPAADGVGIRGWFIPGGGAPGPAVVFVHGWMWNRLGNVGGQVKGLRDADVDFLPAIHALHDAGFHVLTFDVRRHGESEAGGRRPISYGPIEARDYIGAVRYLRTRADVDGSRIGAVGCSMGGNIVIMGTPEVQPIKALLAIQPTRLAVFNSNFMRTEVGALGPAMTKPMELVYSIMGTPRPAKHDPAVAARQLGDTVVQYVQGTGDPWGEMGIVQEFAAVTPTLAGPVIEFPSEGRYEGYRYISERVDDVVGFFQRYV
ncbi:MAG TPA: alpha/beta fold hydrolase [Solirubrobacter sp.]|nr:alpha/beta fold hydrolase [Solirubrobacter sp.]